jgi:hypothetical protein
MNSSILSYSNLIKPSFLKSLIGEKHASEIRCKGLGLEIKKIDKNRQIKAKRRDTFLKLLKIPLATVGI